MKKLQNLFLLTFVAFLFHGCSIKEDFADCGMQLQFRYTMNLSGTDKFTTDVDDVSVYVFDSNTGKYVTEFRTTTANLISLNTMRIKLPAGTYDFLVWGDILNDPRFSITQHVPGITLMTDSRLCLLRELGNSMCDGPRKLYYGTLRQVQVSQSAKTEVVYLMKDASRVKVTATGLPVGSMTNPEPTFACRIIGLNGDYDCDNNPPAGCNNIIYKPNYTTTPTSFSATLDVLRLFNNNACASRLIITYTDNMNQEREIFNKPLIAILKALPGNPDLDIMDYFEIEIPFDNTFVATEIIVNGYHVNVNDIVLG